MIPREIRMAVSIAALVIMMIIIVLALSYCSERDRARKADGERQQAEGRTTSAVEAINEIGQLEDRGRATEAQVEQAHDAIRQADPADRDAVARRQLCLLQRRDDCADGVQ